MAAAAAAGADAVTVLSCGVLLAASGWAWARAPRTGRALGWRMVAVLGAVYAVAWTGWVTSGKPELSAWDVPITVATATVGVAVLVLVLQAGPRPRRSLVLDAVLIGLAVAALVVAFLLPVALDGAVAGDGWYARGIHIAFPLADGVQLALIAAGAALTGWRGDPALALVTGAFLLLFAGDLVHLDRTMMHSDEWFAQALWAGTFVLCTIAVTIDRPGLPRTVRERSWPSLLAPLLAIGTGLAIVVADDVAGGSPWRSALGVLVVVLGTARLAIFYAEDRALNEHLEVATRLARDDPLTGLANHRTFLERLSQELVRAERDGTPLALVMVDLDHFKDVNDTHGHQVGDEVLREVAGRLRAAAREGDVVGRVGGEEFGWILPGCTEARAWEAAERARRAMRGTPVPAVGTVTMSAGVAERAGAAGAADLVRRADAALYAAKAGGRDVVARHGDGAVPLIGGAGRDARPQAVAALRALARALDALRGTERRCDRVAGLAVLLGRATGVPEDRLPDLAEAALLHDVGRAVAGPGAAPATTAALGARLLAGALAPDQVRWVHSAAERYDGSGGPAGLAGERIPLGARVIAVAAACDALTHPAPGGPPRTVAEALADLRARAGTELCPAAVAAAASLPSIPGSGD
jgi:diguanylate cyclase (GGDEF)-like protein